MCAGCPDHGFMSGRPTESLLVFAACLSIYGALPTVNYYWDGLIYADFLERADTFGPALFHPNHLIYNFVGFLIFRLFHNLAFSDRALFALQYLSIFFASAAVAIFYLICRRFFVSVYLSLTVTGILAFAASWWRFATDANVYVISIAFLLLSFFFLVDTPPKPVLAAISFFGALLFHELAVLFLPAGCLALWLAEVEQDSRKRIRNIAVFALLTAALIILSYLSAFYSISGGLDAGAFGKWTTSFADAARHGPEAISAFFWFFKGTRQLFIDGSVNLLDGGLASWTLFLLFCAAACLLLVSLVSVRSSIIRLFSDREWLKDVDRFLLAVCAAWVVPYICFFFLFEPQNTFYRLFYLPALVLIVGVALSSATRNSRYSFIRALFVLVFALYNLVFYIYPNSYPRSGTVLALALDANRVWDEKTSVCYELEGSTDAGIREVIYFNRAVTWLPVDSLTLEDIQARFPAIYADNGTVWFEDNALRQIESDPERLAALASRYIADPGTELAVPKHGILFRKLEPRR
jgi:hypothetical protein